MTDSLARDVDPFHTQSHPVRDLGEDRGSVYVQAHEAVLDYDRAAQGSSSKNADAVRWRGIDSEKREVEIWTDRFDAIHLLTDLPPALPVDALPPSPTGMSDLPSDSEDVFFMQASEANEYQTRKRMQRWETQRQARILARRGQEENDASEQKEDPVEELTADQLSLMERTAGALKGAANPALLEMKILANHGSDPRFSFLRKGKEQRWSDVWGRLKSGPSEPREGQSSALVDYGSDSSTDQQDAADAGRKRKLALAREWSRKRKARDVGEE